MRLKKLKIFVFAVLLSLLFVLPVSAQITKTQTLQDLSAAALSYILRGGTFKVLWVHFTFDAATTETITIEIDNAASASYDSTLKSQSLVAATSYFWMPEGELIIQGNDGLRVTCTNGSGVNIVYVTIMTVPR